MENNNLENNNTNQAAPEIVGQSYNQQIMSNAQPQNLSVSLQNAVSEKFSPEDLNKINELSNSIDLKDSVSVMSYGAAAQNKMIQFSENTLSNVMNKDLGEVGEAITNVVTEL